MLDFLDYTGSDDVNGGIAENVCGFGNTIAEHRWIATPYCRTKPKSWAPYFAGRLREQGSVVRCLKLDNITFLTLPVQGNLIVHVASLNHICVLACCIACVAHLIAGCISSS